MVERGVVIARITTTKSLIAMIDCNIVCRKKKKKKKIKTYLYTRNLYANELENRVVIGDNNASDIAQRLQIE